MCHCGEEGGIFLQYLYFSVDTRVDEGVEWLYVLLDYLIVGGIRDWHSKAAERSGLSSLHASQISHSLIRCKG